ncbi:MAG: DegT/DnrJ/EryC1/StrS family aminotransferase [Salinivirgaceae bacterium]|jgi:dTDP-4-amino-4,6-dideoxygalactose transaminase|nr:DegT/DnrJ/EryC1/StrS family aminotransferase [Salinivirgaceae bacterium]
MKYSYNNPNLRFVDFFTAIFVSTKNAQDRLSSFFSDLTGKKYILLTNSCRTALYLSYQVLPKKGQVITSPLTCKVAIDPIVESGDTPVYADISLGNLNIALEDIEHRITPETIAIQAIHLGGISCDMSRIMKIAHKHNLPVIEDCAQSLGASYQGKPTGSFGDIACFSLIKNAHGIAGGVFATSNKDYYTKAVAINRTFTNGPAKIRSFRVIRNLLATKQNGLLWRILYKAMLKIKGHSQRYSSVVTQLHQIASIEIKIASHQLGRFKKLQAVRKQIGMEYYKRLKRDGLIVNNDYLPEASSFTKFFIFNPEIDTIAALEFLNNQGIQSRHLEDKTGSPYQKPLISKNDAIKNGLVKYLQVHDHLISLPMNTGLNTGDQQFIHKHLSTAISL